MAVGQRGDAQGDQDDGDVAGEQAEGTDEAKFFRDRGEDEVSVALGQELQLALATEAIALAQQTAGAEGDLRLDDIVAGARGIGLRVHEGQNAVALVLVHAEHDERRDDRYSGRRPGGDDPPAQAGHDHDRPSGQANDHGRPEVRLFGDQNERQADHARRDQQLPGPTGLLGRMAVVPARQRQNETQLHELGGLDADEAEVEPVPGAARDIAERRELDHQDQQQKHAVEGVGGAEPPFRVKHGQHQHHDQQRAEADHMLDRPGLPLSARDRIEHGRADEGDQTQQADEAPVQFGDLGRQPVALAGTGQGGSGHCAGSAR